MGDQTTFTSIEKQMLSAKSIAEVFDRSERTICVNLGTIIVPVGTLLTALADALGKSVLQVRTAYFNVLRQRLCGLSAILVNQEARPGDQIHMGADQSHDQ
jgi:hypothetical protein